MILKYFETYTIVWSASILLHTLFEDMTKENKHNDVDCDINSTYGNNN